jgi:hypothetical protein
MPIFGQIVRAKIFLFPVLCKNLTPSTDRSFAAIASKIWHTYREGRIFQVTAKSKKNLD